jgi:hypothetical protein
MLEGDVLFASLTAITEAPELQEDEDHAGLGGHFYYHSHDPVSPRYEYSPLQEGAQRGRRRRSSLKRSGSGGNLAALAASGTPMPSAIATAAAASTSSKARLPSPTSKRRLSVKAEPAPQGKRESHNVSERQRRQVRPAPAPGGLPARATQHCGLHACQALKDSFDSLRVLVPSIADDFRAHTGQILEETISYIRELQQTEVTLQEEKEALREENERLRTFFF